MINSDADQRQEGDEREERPVVHDAHLSRIVEQQIPR